MGSNINGLHNLSPYATVLKEKLERFVHERCQPAELEYEKHISQFTGNDRFTIESVPPCIDRLKHEAKELGLWNLFLPCALPRILISNDDNKRIPSPTVLLSVREYGILCEIMGRSFLCPEACNCSAPDTGNMEVLLQHGSVMQQRRYLPSLLNGSSRSAFLMTEPKVASSDATNIECSLRRTGENKFVLNGTKWWSTGAMDPRCRTFLILARSSEEPLQKSGSIGQKKTRHGAHTVVIIPKDTPGIRVTRALTVFGYDDAPHGHAEVVLDNVEVNGDAIVWGLGKGFEIAQSRLGPGRVHHCMRAVGLAARCYDLMLQRVTDRKVFGKPLYAHGMCQNTIASSRTDLECARLLTLSCAAAIDAVGAAKAMDHIAMIKVAVPALAHAVVDRAIQIHGGAGVCSDLPLARAAAALRSLRIADGPDAVHLRTLANLEVRAWKKRQINRSKM